MRHWQRWLVLGAISAGLVGCGSDDSGGKAEPQGGGGAAAAGGGGPPAAPGGGGGAGGGGPPGMAGGGGGGGAGMMGGPPGMAGGGPPGMAGGGRPGAAQAGAGAAEGAKELFQYLPENLTIATGANFPALSEKSNVVGPRLLVQFQPITAMLARAGLKIDQLENVWSGNNRETGDLVICVRTKANYDAAAVTKGLGAVGEAEKVGKASVHQLPTNPVYKNAVAYVDPKTMLIGRYDTVLAALKNPKPGPVRQGLDALGQPDAYYWLAGDESVGGKRLASRGIVSFETLGAEGLRARGFAMGFGGGRSQAGGGGGFPGGGGPPGMPGGGGPPGGFPGGGGPGGGGPPGGFPGGGGPGGGGPPGGFPGGGGPGGGGPPGGFPGGGGPPGMPSSSGGGGPSGYPGGGGPGGSGGTNNVDLAIGLNFASEAQASAVEQKITELSKAVQQGGFPGMPGAGGAPGQPGAGGFPPGAPGAPGQPGAPGGPPGGFPPGAPGGPPGAGPPGGFPPGAGGGRPPGAGAGAPGAFPPGAGGPPRQQFQGAPPGAPGAPGQPGAPGGPPGGFPPGAPGAPGGAAGGFPPGAPGGPPGGFPGMPGAGGSGGGEARQVTTFQMQVVRDKENLKFSMSLPAVGMMFVTKFLNDAISASGASTLSDGIFDGTITMLSSGMQQLAAGKPDAVKGVRRIGELPIRAGYSWMTELLPFVGHQDLYTLFDFSKSWSEKENLQHTATSIPAFLNPADPRSHWDGFPFEGLGLTHFAGMAGIEDRRNVVAAELPRSDPRAGIFGYDDIARHSDITDGTSQTIMLIGTGEVAAPWVQGGGATIRGARAPYFDKFTGFGSRGLAKPGTYVLFADGSARTISADIDPEVFKAMCTMHGAEQVDMTKLITLGTD